MNTKLQYAIALTGSIGSGKSTLVSLLSLYGFKCVCADTISREMLEKHASEVIEYFGDGIVENGEISRKKLGEIVFSQDSKRKALESILHPHIRDEIFKQALVLEKSKTWYFLDIPLFFEVGGKETYPVARSLVIYIPEKDAIGRIMCRDGLSEEEALARLHSQIPIEEKCRLADDVIGNDSDLRALQHRLEKYIKSLPNIK